LKRALTLDQFHAQAKPDSARHGVEHRLAERPAVMEFRLLIGAGRVAVGGDMNHPDRSMPPAVTSDGLQDGQSHRMVAPDRKRRHAGVDDQADVTLDMTLIECSGGEDAVAEL
jgi:hypothetical protein